MLCDDDISLFFCIVHPALHWYSIYSFLFPHYVSFSHGHTSYEGSVPSYAIMEFVHSFYSTGSITPAFNMQSISSLNFSLYRGFGQYGLCFTSLALVLRWILISPSSLAIPFISEKLLHDELCDPRTCIFICKSKQFLTNINICSNLC